jgi:hypothetical protein
MEHIPAIHAAKVGMRFPARVTMPFFGGATLSIDLSAIAPGRDPRLWATLYVHMTVARATAEALTADDRLEVVLITNSQHDDGRCVSLPAPYDWLTWNGGTVRALAQRIRDTNDEALYPILADALEDAGCTEAELLARCRDPHGDSLTWLGVLLATQE